MVFFESKAKLKQDIKYNFNFDQNTESLKPCVKFKSSRTRKKEEDFSLCVKLF